MEEMRRGFQERLDSMATTLRDIQEKLNSMLTLTDCDGGIAGTYSPAAGNASISICCCPPEPPSVEDCDAAITASALLNIEDRDVAITEPFV